MQGLASAVITGRVWGPICSTWPTSWPTPQQCRLVRLCQYRVVDTLCYPFTGNVGCGCRSRPRDLQGAEQVGNLYNSLDLLWKGRFFFTLKLRLIQQSSYYILSHTTSAFNIHCVVGLHVGWCRSQVITLLRLHCHIELDSTSQP